MTAKLPSMTVRNAIAFVDAYGDHFGHSHASVRNEAERHGVVFDIQGGAEKGTPLTFYRVTDEGRAIAATGTLAPCLAWAAERGFTIDRDHRRKRARKPKPGSIPLINEAGERAWIYGGRRVYLDHGLAFEGKPSRLAGGAK